VVINVREITLTIEGMHCEACVRRVSRALQGVAGTVVEQVRIGTVVVRSVEIAPVLAAIAKAGYIAHAEQK